MLGLGTPAWRLRHKREKGRHSRANGNPFGDFVQFLEILDARSPLKACREMFREPDELGQGLLARETLCKEELWSSPEDE
jgi:hypothetical protein